jgi:RHS repeat-associated protein
MAPRVLNVLDRTIIEFPSSTGKLLKVMNSARLPLLCMALFSGLAGAFPTGQLLGPTGTTTNPAGSAGQPNQQVNTETGNLYLAYTDYVVPGRGLSFTFTRSYNSLDTYSGPLGIGWTHSYNIILTVLPGGNVKIKDADGHEVIFALSGGSYTPPPGDFDVLTMGTATFILTRPNQTQFIFNFAGQLISIVDRNGNTQTLTYTGGNLTQLTDTSGRIFTFAYDTSQHLTSLSAPPVSGNPIVIHYTVSSSLTSSQDANGHTTSYSYSSGILTSITDPSSKPALAVAYTGGSVTTLTAGGIATTGFAYNTPTANTTQITDPNKNKYFHTYNAASQLVQLTDALAGVTKWTYDALNEITTITNPAGFVTSYSYDANGNRTRVTDPAGDVTAFTFDIKNDLINSINASGGIISYTYDANGNRLTLRDPLGYITKYAYDQFGERISVTDAKGNVTQYFYNANGDMITVTDPLGQVSGYTYDNAGNQITFVNPRGKTYSYSYDPMNRRMTQTDPLHNTIFYFYDADGNLTGQANPNGSSKLFGYDGLNRQISIQAGACGDCEPSPVAAITYDPSGNRTKVCTESFASNGCPDPAATTLYAFDALNRLTSSCQPRTAAGSIPSCVSYSYDSIGRRTQLVYPDGKTVTYAYDAANRIHQVSDWAARTTTYSYTGVGKPTNIASPNTSVTYTYDLSGRLTSVKNTYKTATGTASILFKYTLDAVGNPIRANDAYGNPSILTYDKLNELISVQDSTGITRFAYDANGNRSSLTAPGGVVTTYSYDDADQILTAGPQSFVHDANGNMVSRNSPGGTTNYTFDAFNRLTAINNGSTYTYDGLGARVGKTEGGTSTNYTYDNATPFAVVLQESDTTGTNTVTTSYLRGRSLIAADNGSSFDYYFGEREGSIIGMANGSSGFLDGSPFAYSSFGVLAAPLSTSLGAPYRFIGETLDTSNLYYLRARYYDPSLGRFLTRDPYEGRSSYPIGKNRYIYSRNNPLKLFDPSGMDPGDEDDPFGDDAGSSVTEWPFAPDFP